MLHLQLEMRGGGGVVEGATRLGQGGQLGRRQHYKSNIKEWKSFKLAKSCSQPIPAPVYCGCMVRSAFVAVT